MLWCDQFCKSKNQPWGDAEQGITNGLLLIMFVGLFKDVQIVFKGVWQRVSSSKL